VFRSCDGSRNLKVAVEGSSSFRGIGKFGELRAGRNMGLRAKARLRRQL
jgi:hypothetical protein